MNPIINYFWPQDPNVGFLKTDEEKIDRSFLCKEILTSHCKNDDLITELYQDLYGEAPNDLHVFKKPSNKKKKHKIKILKDNYKEIEAKRILGKMKDIAERQKTKASKWHIEDLNNEYNRLTNVSKRALFMKIHEIFHDFRKIQLNKTCSNDRVIAFVQRNEIFEKK